MALQPLEAVARAAKVFCFQSPLTGQWPCNDEELHQQREEAPLSVPSNGAMALQRLQKAPPGQGKRLSVPSNGAMALQLGLLMASGLVKETFSPL